MTRPAERVAEPAVDQGAVTDRDAGTDRDAAIAELAALSLPLMWSLRQEAVRLYEPLGIRPTRVLVLELVSRGIDRPGMLADVLDTVPPAVTAMLNQLDERGLLVREPDTRDRRRTRLRLTEAGTALLATTRARWHEATRARLDALTTHDLLVMLRTLRSFLSHDAREAPDAAEAVDDVHALEAIGTDDDEARARRGASRSGDGR